MSTNIDTVKLVIKKMKRSNQIVEFLIVAYLLKARTVKPEKRSLLGNGCVTQQWS
jgi:hypothetical protein